MGLLLATRVRSAKPHFLKWRSVASLHRCFCSTKMKHAAPASIIWSQLTQASTSNFTEVIASLFQEFATNSWPRMPS